MGKIITAECKSCNRLFNYDVGIGDVYTKDYLINFNSDFNLFKLYKTTNNKKHIINLLKSSKYSLSDDYEHCVYICDTCKGLFSRFYFKIIDENNNIAFEPLYKCHETRRTLRKLSEDELENNLFKCPYCKNDIKFHVSGYWN